MATPQLHEEFAVFGLPCPSEIEDVDERYFIVVSRIMARKKLDPEGACKEIKRIDDALGTIIRYHILQRPSEPRRRVSFDDIVKRRDSQSVNQPLRHFPLQAPSALNRSPLAGRDERARGKSVAGRLGAFDWLEDLEKHGALSAEHDSSKVQPHQGDILADAPDRAIIVHATNCMGLWGAGFASQLKQHCRQAYSVYKHNCSRNIVKSPGELAGTCLLIEPQKRDYLIMGGQVVKPRRYIACLFTSVGFGRRSANHPGKDCEADILMNTDCALNDLRSQLIAIDESAQSEADKPGNFFSNQFNSGLFEVPWENTKDLIERTFEDCGREWTVYSDLESSRAKRKRSRSEGDEYSVDHPFRRRKTD